jgi:hypothetical protein
MRCVISAAPFSEWFRIDSALLDRTLAHLFSVRIPIFLLGALCFVRIGYAPFTAGFSVSLTIGGYPLSLIIKSGLSLF